MRRRHVLGAAGLALVALAAWWCAGGSTVAEPPVASTAGPTSPARGRLRVPRRVREPSERGAAQPTRAVVRGTVLVVHLRDPAEGFLVWSHRAPLRPERLPEGPEEGEPDEGWLALADLGEERDFVTLAYEEAFLEASLEVEGQVAPAELLGPPPAEELVGAALDLADTFPEHPATEVALLLAADGLQQLGAEDDAANLASRLVVEAADLEVAAQAASVLSRLPHAEVEPGVLDALAVLADEAPDSLERGEVVSFALNAALRSGDLERARGWLDRLGAVAEEQCGGDGWADEMVCADYTDALDAVVGWLGDVRPADAESWQQAMQLAGQGCARSELPPGATRLETEASWTGDAWTFADPWAPEGFAACFEAGVRAGPAPDGPLSVRVTIVGVAG